MTQVKKVNPPKWTEKEINTLMTTVKEFPDNKQVAFEKVSAKLNRPVQGVSMKYYTLYKAGKTSTFTGSVEGGFSKKKNTNRVKGIFKRQEELSPALALVQQFLSMSKDNRDAVLTFLNKVH